MAGERVQRQIGRLLDEAEAAASRLDWARVRRRAQAVLALDPGNRDAAGYLEAAERALGSGDARPRRRRWPVPGLPGIPFLERHATPALATVLAFALAARLIGLWYPPVEYYDEVYHAFTAQEMLRGNPAAWEWWSQAPPGYAYEWTHPPLAKLLMAAGIMVAGDEKSFGWRLPAALGGTGAVYLLYLLGRALFQNETGGIVAAGLFALDGLPLAMSRIGMNDIYLTAASLGAVYFFLRERHLLSAIFLGLAVASKWSGVWVVPVLVAMVVLLRKEPRLTMLWLVAVPPAIYLAAYVPFFLTGHSLSQFIELHRQIWWYQTNLEATHTYQSSWWSWPLLLRPLWMFTAARESLVSNIYAMGNPLVFWAGLAAVGAAGLLGLRGYGGMPTGLLAWVGPAARRPGPAPASGRRHPLGEALAREARQDPRALTAGHRTLLFIAVAWGLLFMPWALSPRILFIQHYLPAVPFLALALAWILMRSWNTRFRWLAMAYPVLALASFLFFFPHWTGIFVPRWWDELYYWLPSWR